MKKFVCVLLAAAMMLACCACAESKAIKEQLSVKIDNKEHMVSYTLYKDGSGYCWTTFSDKNRLDEDCILVKYLIDLMAEYFDTYDVAGTVGGKVYKFHFVEGELTETVESDNWVEYTAEEVAEAIELQYSKEAERLRSGLDELMLEE